MTVQCPHNSAGVPSNNNNPERLRQPISMQSPHSTGPTTPANQHAEPALNRTHYASQSACRARTQQDPLRQEGVYKQRSLPSWVFDWSSSSPQHLSSSSLSAPTRSLHVCRARTSLEVTPHLPSPYQPRSRENLCSSCSLNGDQTPFQLFSEQLLTTSVRYI